MQRYNKLWAAIGACGVQALVLFGVPEAQADAYVQAVSILATPVLVWYVRNKE